MLIMWSERLRPRKLDWLAGCQCCMTGWGESWLSTWVCVRVNIQKFTVITSCRNRSLTDDIQNVLQVCYTHVYLSLVPKTETELTWKTPFLCRHALPFWQFCLGYRKNSDYIIMLCSLAKIHNDSNDLPDLILIDQHPHECAWWSIWVMETGMLVTTYHLTQLVSHTCICQIVVDHIGTSNNLWFKFHIKHLTHNSWQQAKV